MPDKSKSTELSGCGRVSVGFCEVRISLNLLSSPIWFCMHNKSMSTELSSCCRVRVGLFVCTTKRKSTELSGLDANT